jgi:cell division septation protein DedD
MSSGPRPGRPIMGQRPMFGGGGSVFARMPSYTPVTRGPDQEPHQPERTQPAAYPQGAQGYPSANYPSPSQAPAQPYPTHPSANPAPARPRAGAQQGTPQGYPAGNGYPGQGQGYAHLNQGYPAPGYPDQGYAGQGYPGQGYPSQSQPSQGYQQASPPEASFDANYADAEFTNASFQESTFPEANFSDTRFPAAGFPAQNGSDASFSEDGHAEDASFPEDTNFAGNDAYAPEEPLNLEMPNGGGYTQEYHPHNDQARHAAMAAQGGYAAPADPHRALQPFDAIYDQPPQISLGSTEQGRRSTQGFYEGERPDADFLDDGQTPDAAIAAAQTGRKMTMRSRSMFMVGSALLGAVALGGALAFAYKQSGGAMNGEPPLVQADSRPVKEAPDQPGGKEFPHKNKLIYDRLENGDKPEAEHIVPRQEDVVMPAMPASTDTAGLPVAGMQVATAPQTTQAVDAGAIPGAVATVDDPEGGPRRVKTLVVRPDGSVMQPAVPGIAAEPAPAPAAAPQQVARAEAVPAAPAPIQAHLAAAPAGQPAAQPAPAQAVAPAPAAADPQQVASIPPAKPKPVKAAVAAEDPAPKAAAPKTPSQFVVQVGSKQNQTEALATFADMQQKYPTLLANYRPMVQKADLGTKGVWYRLRIGPIVDKTAASKLCTQLKSQGLNDCLVMTE